MSGELLNLVRNLFPGAGAPLRALHQSVVDNGPLLPVDFLSIQDLLALSDYGDQESLHVLLLLMFLALQEGSLCVEISRPGLASRLSDLVGDEQADPWVTSILADLAEGRFPRLIGNSPQDARPLLLCSSGERQFLYFHKYLRSESALGDELRQRLRAREPVAEVDWQPILRDVLHERPLQLASGPLRLDDDQLRAVECSLTTNFLIVSGGPGTGKTSIVLTLLRCLMRGGLRPDQVALAAPTGRAAQRLTDSLRSGLEKIAAGPDEHDLLLHSLQAGTLHHLLEYSSSRGTFRRHRENPLDAEVVIVDEVSMVGVVLMAQLLQALRPECKLIFLGDKDQLPSVEAGAVLASLVPEPAARELGSEATSTSDYVVLLRTNHRSQREIQAAAAAINRQDAAIASRLPVQTLPAEDWMPAWWQAIESAGGCWLLEQSTGTAQTAELRRVLQRWASHHFLGRYSNLVPQCELFPGAEADPMMAERLRELFRNLESNRILTLVRAGTFGCVGINQYLDGILRPSLDRGSRGHLFAGAPVLITANDHVRQLYNGDVGVVLKCASTNRPQSLRAVFPRRSGFESFAVESLPSHELGLALTVHKSQGSEYDSVLLVLPPSGGRRLLTKEILYTGVTRARNLVLIAGTREMLRLAVGRKIMRESGLLKSNFSLDPLQPVQ
jgi:exodeoxyribonuclease V alpha subunit